VRSGTWFPTSDVWSCTCPAPIAMQPDHEVNRQQDAQQSSFTPTGERFAAPPHNPAEGGSHWVPLAIQQQPSGVQGWGRNAFGGPTNFFLQDPYMVQQPFYAPVPLQWPVQPTIGTRPSLPHISYTASTAPFQERLGKRRKTVQLTPEGFPTWNAFPPGPSGHDEPSTGGQLPATWARLGHSASFDGATSSHTPAAARGRCDSVPDVIGL
jgi:hypothetical protein